MKAFIALFLLLATTALAGVSIINGDNWCGFRQKADFQKLVRIATQGDSAAYGRTLMEGLRSNQCVMFTNGQPVYLVSPGVTLIKVRPAGQTNEYWTAIESIRR